MISLITVNLCGLSVIAKDTSSTFKKSKLKVEELKEDAPELKQTKGGKKSLYAVKAVKMLQTNDRQGAIRMLNKGIAEDPSFAELYSFRAMLYSDAGNFQGALADRDKVISLSKDNQNLSKAYLSRGLLKRSSKQFANYEIDFKKAVVADTTNSVAQFVYGEHLVKIGKGKQAIPHLEKAKKYLSKDESVRMIPKIDALLKKAKTQ